MMMMNNLGRRNGTGWNPIHKSKPILFEKSLQDLHTQSTHTNWLADWIPQP